MIAYNEISTSRSGCFIFGCNHVSNIPASRDAGRPAQRSHSTGHFQKLFPRLFIPSVLQ